MKDRDQKIKNRTCMVRLMQDHDLKNLFKSGHPETLRRYWVFPSEYYVFSDELGVAAEEEGDYIEHFRMGNSNAVDVGKFDLASRIWGLDEFTYIAGFIASRKDAVAISEFISKPDHPPGRVLLEYPSIELIEFLWVDGWWEVRGDLKIITDIVRPKLAYVDIKNGGYFFDDPKKYGDAYEGALKELADKIAVTKASFSS